jgi:hypothetical protein
VDTGNYIRDKQHKVKDKLHASTGGENTLIQKNKQAKMMRGNKNITQNIRTMKKILLTNLR